MKELRTPTGQRFWEPTDANDRALLAMAEGVAFSKTTFPSGWVSPEGTQEARDGMLYETDEIDWSAVQRTESSIMGSAPYRGPSQQWGNGMNAEPIPWVTIVLAIGAFVLGMRAAGWI